jgi:hypothetical protein
MNNGTDKVPYLGLFLFLIFSKLLSICDCYVVSLLICIFTFLFSVLVIFHYIYIRHFVFGIGWILSCYFSSSGSCSNILNPIVWGLVISCCNDLRIYSIISALFCSQFQCGSVLFAFCIMIMVLLCDIFCVFLSFYQLITLVLQSLCWTIFIFLYTKLLLLYLLRSVWYYINVLSINKYQDTQQNTLWSFTNDFK